MEFVSWNRYDVFRLVIFVMLFLLVKPQSMLGGVSLGSDGDALCFSCPCSHWLILPCLLRNPVFPSLRFHLLLKINSGETEQEGGKEARFGFLLGSFCWIKVPPKWSAVNGCESVYVRFIYDEGCCVRLRQSVIFIPPLTVRKTSSSLHILPATTNKSH